MKNRPFSSTLPLIFALTLILSQTPGRAGAVEPVWPEGGRSLTPALFRPPAGEGAAFEAASAAAGQPGGFMVTPSGPAVYCEPAGRPLEIQWLRPAAAPGQAAKAEGYGEMTLKYADDNMILERYRGGFKNGYRDGRGELLARDSYRDNAFFYRGDFRQGRLEGQGVYINNDFQNRGEAPFIYEGEFLADAFHGRGVMTDLVSGRIIHSGLWFDGFPFEGEEEQWARANRQAGLEVRLAARPAVAGSAGDSR